MSDKTKEQELIEESLNEMKEEAIRNFKRGVKEKIGVISEKQRQISNIQLELERAKKEIKELTLICPDGSLII